MMALPPDTEAHARSLAAFIDASPSPYHAVATAADVLVAAGFHQLDETAAWRSVAGRYFVVRGGSLVAWVVGPNASPQSGFRLIGAHTDSPNLRLKPRPDTGNVGYRQLGVEVYGGVLLNSWLDRDLGLSGRVALRNGTRSPEVRLVRIDRPLLRIPQLAIHLDRGVNENGLKLNPQTHLAPVWGLGPVDEGRFAQFIAKELGVAADALLSWDLMTHDLTPSTLLGEHLELLSAPRIDNLLSCWAAIESLTACASAVGDHGSTAAELPLHHVPVVCLFDHEEIGSESASGAASSLLPTILERISMTLDGAREDFHRGLAESLCISADGAHATHPNYPERHEPGHRVRLNAGPVIKINANVRYATDAVGAAHFKLACERAGVPWQEFVVRSDLPCGSTIGPITAARLGIPTVDVGVAQLAMHSARELCGSADPALFVSALTEFLRG